MNNNVYNDYCELCCCSPCICNRYYCKPKFEKVSYCSFEFYKIDGNTGIGLSGAKFELKKGNSTVASAISDNDGKVTFENVKVDCYVMYEVAAPYGYENIEEKYRVVIKNGIVKINCVPANDFTVSNYPSNYTITYDLNSIAKIATLSCELNSI